MICSPLTQSGFWKSWFHDLEDWVYKDGFHDTGEIWQGGIVISQNFDGVNRAQSINTWGLKKS